MGVSKSASMDPSHAREAAFAIATSHIVVRATAALVELNVFDALIDRSLTLQELAAAAMPGKAVNLRNLERLLRLMISHSGITETVADAGESRYQLGPLGKFFVKAGVEDCGSFAHYLVYSQTPAVVQNYRPLSDLVVTERDQEFNGGTLYEFHKRHPELNKLFNQGMDGNSKVMMHAIMDEYRSGFEDVRVLVDVGGGFGASLAAIRERYPHIKGVNFDLAGVIAECLQLPGIEHVSGDMLESVPRGGDAIFLKWILHNWGDEDVVKVLRNCWEALPRGGKAIVIDHVVPEVIDPEEVDKAIMTMDVMMMAHHNAQERKESEFRRLGLAAGFTQVNLVCQIRSSGSVVEMIKA